MRMQRKLIGAHEVAGLLGVHRATVHRWTYDRAVDLPAPVRLQKKLVWDLAEIEAWLERKFQERKSR